MQESLSRANFEFWFLCFAKYSQKCFIKYHICNYICTVKNPKITKFQETKNIFKIFNSRGKCNNLWTFYENQTTFFRWRWWKYYRLLNIFSFKFELTWQCDIRIHLQNFMLHWSPAVGACFFTFQLLGESIVTFWSSLLHPYFIPANNWDMF